MHSSYHVKRKQFYQGIPDFWPNLYDEEYALYDIYLTDQSEIEKIRLATERVGRIFFKIAKLLRKVPDDILLEMGFPAVTLSFLRLKPILSESVISRLDLICSGNSYKCLEINSDTPTFIKELFYINDLICKEFGKINPNHGMEQLLSAAIRNNVKALLRLRDGEEPSLVFTAHDDHLEDRNTVLYLQELAKLPSRFVPLHRLRIVKGEGLFDENGKKIDILYRQTFPIESLILDEDNEGNHIGQWLLELICLGKLAIINPPSAFLLQNKAVQAAIWGLHEENHTYFTAEEHEWIAEHFLPTYLDPDPFLKEELPYVKKPAFGREGDTVEIYDGSGRLLFEDSQKSYSEYLPVYQKYVELPEVTFSSEKGSGFGHMLIGSFLIDGKAAAVGCRVGKKITDNLSYFLPIGIKMY